MTKKSGRDTTLERLRPDEDEQRARALAKLVRPAASELGGSDDSLSRSGSGSDVSRLSADQLLPFETPIQVWRRCALGSGPAHFGGFQKWSNGKTRDSLLTLDQSAEHLSLLVSRLSVIEHLNLSGQFLVSHLSIPTVTIWSV